MVKKVITSLVEEEVEGKATRELPRRHSHTGFEVPRGPTSLS